MEWNIPEDLRDYVQGQVLPLYQRSDSAHGPEHIRQVLANSWELAQGLGADLRLVYVVAAYHDLGIAFLAGRTTTSPRRGSCGKTGRFPSGSPQRSGRPWPRR